MTKHQSLWLERNEIRTRLAPSLTLATQHLDRGRADEDCLQLLLRHRASMVS